MKALSLFTLLLTALWQPLFAAGSVDAACVGVRIGPDGIEARHRALVCEGIARGLRFFEGHAIALRHDIGLDLATNNLDSTQNHIGLYQAGAKRITLLTYDAAHARGDVFRSPMNEALYVSFVVHELAHAIADQHFSTGSASLLGHEYLAYVAQLSSLPDDQRAAILERYRLKRFSEPREMSQMFYHLDPTAFGIKAYLHYQGLADKQAFVRKLLDGSIRMPGEYTDWW